MIRLGADENFDNDILRGVARLNPNSTSSGCRMPGLRGADDSAVLEWAGAEGRVLLTHDLKTMTRYAYERVAAGRRMPGIFGVRTDVPLSVAIQDLLLVAECSVDGEWEGQVRYLPLR